MIEITNLSQLQAMKDNLSEDYVLKNDIDASATQNWNEDPENPGTYLGFQPIGDGTNKFTGSFDGQGFKITGLFINRETSYNGLFGYADTSKYIRNVLLSNVDITGGLYTAGIGGRIRGGCTVSKCFVTGSIDGRAGIVAFGTQITIEDCGVDIALETSANGGGISDYLISSTVRRCYAKGTLHRYGAGTTTSAGLIRYVASGCSVSDCFAHNTVFDDEGIGRYQAVVIDENNGIITRVYGKGFVGYLGMGVCRTNNGTITSSFWDTQTSETTTSQGGLGRTTSQMHDEETYSGWDFENTWRIDSTMNDGYPHFRGVYVKTLFATEVKEASAKLQGNLPLMLGEATVNCYFKYREQGVGAWVNTAPAETLSEPSNFEKQILGLTAGTTYEFKAVAVYGTTHIAGDTLTFKTVKVQTKTASEVTFQSARLNGRLEGMGTYSPFTLYFKWREQGGTWETTGTISRSYESNFHVDISGLDPHVNYEFQAFGEYNGETAEGEILSFSTIIKDPPEVITDNAVQIDSDAVRLKGIISLGDYADADCFFRYREKGESVWIETSPKETKSSAGAFTKEVSGLSVGTYEFRAVAEYNGSEVLGAILEFEIADVIVVTEDATEILDSTVVLNGELLDLGSEDSVEVFFKYRRHGVTEWTETEKQTASEPIIFAQALSGLTPGQTYYFKAVAEFGESVQVSGVTKHFTLQVGMLRVFIRPDGCEKGDLFYHDGQKLVRLPKGNAGQRLRMGADDIPEWYTP